MPTLARLENENINFRYSSTNELSSEYQIHCHNIYEVYYFIDGDVDYLVEGKQYHPTPHSLLLLSPHVFHGVRINSEKTYTRFTIHFSPDVLNMEHRSLLLSAFPSAEKYSSKEVYYENINAFQLHPFFEAIANCSNQPDRLSAQLFPIYLEALLAQLTLMCRTLRPMENGITVSSTMTNVIAYLNTHLSEKITLDGISEHFFISKHYLNRAFRKATGTTVCDYLIYKRVIYAQNLLMNGYSASEAAIASGFGDYSSFYRAYQKITKHSPNHDIKN